jgi:hypothetical protein
MKNKLLKPHGSIAVGEVNGESQVKGGCCCVQELFSQQDGLTMGSAAEQDMMGGLNVYTTHAT